MFLHIQEPGKHDAPYAGNVVGIDFGTTHCLVSTKKTGPLLLDDGSPLVPSVIAYESDGSCVVGSAALTKRGAIFSMKRAFEGGKELPFSPSVVAGHILAFLKKKTEEKLQGSVDGVVISVPAYFGERARSSIRLAAHYAGLKVLRLINEPTAAALSYGVDHQKRGCFLVYDFGGGTFDVSVLDLQDGFFQVLAAGGDAHLGGDDIDAVLSKQLKISLLEAKNIKENMLHASCENRLQYEKIISPLIKKSVSIARKTLDEAKRDIEAVLLVGGSTRIPIVETLLKDAFGVPVLKTLNPDQAVGIGAGIHAYNLVHGEREALLMDLTALSLGIETIGGNVEKMILKNTPLPFSVSETFTLPPHQSRERSLKIHIVQGEGEKVEQCRSLGSFVIKGSAFEDRPTFEITFSLDADGLLSVSALHKETGATHFMEFHPQNLDIRETKRLLCP